MKIAAIYITFTDYFTNKVQTLLCKTKQPGVKPKCMDEDGNVFPNFYVQRGLKGSGAEAGSIWVPTELPDPLKIPALILHNHKFGSCFLKAFIYIVFP